MVSFIGLLIGVFPLTGFGGFQGITVHAMYLSVVAAVSMLYNLINYFETKKKIVIVVIIVSFVVILLGASRAALLGSVLGFFILLFKYKNFKLGTIKPLFTIFVLIMISLVVIPDQYLAKLNQKFESSEEAGNALSSRQSLWDARLLEFRESPIYGIGFGNMIETYNDYGINKETGGIETGSSWGMILSMTGILGISTFVILILKRYKYMIVNDNSLTNSFIMSVFTFFLIHMIFEGYIFASGNIFMIFFWLTLSLTEYNFKKQ